MSNQRRIWNDPKVREERLPAAEKKLGRPMEMVDHPPHYTSHPSGIECITITEHMGFNLGNAIKYLWRADEKGDALADLHKAAWYVAREIKRRQILAKMEVRT